MTELWNLILEKFGNEDDISKYSCTAQSDGIMIFSNKRGNKGLVAGAVDICGEEYGRKVRKELKFFSLKEYDIRGFFDEGFASGFFYERRRR